MDTDKLQLPLDIYLKLSNMYNEKHRSYHNMSHIMFCLNELNSIKDEISEQTYVHILLSIWFHDCYYNPYISDGSNEAISLKYYKECKVVLEDYYKGYYGLQINHYQIEEAILATANHLSDNSNKSDITKYMLDIDLAAFGKDYHIVQSNSLKIRSEYSFIPTETIKNNSVKFFTKLYEKSPLYYTNYYSKFENKAKENLFAQIKYNSE